MSDKKQVFLSLETARKMYNKVRSVEGGYLPDNPTILFLLDNFTKEELEVKELPKSLEELEKINGYFIQGMYPYIQKVTSNSNNKKTCTNVFPTKELAEASLALSQLLQLRDVYNGDWKVDLYNRANETRYIIYNRFNDIEKCRINNSRNSPLSFQKESIRDQFVENFEDLIIQALPLL